MKWEKKWYWPKSESLVFDNIDMHCSIRAILIIFPNDTDIA
jgi:hypothetical protein